MLKCESLLKKSYLSYSEKCPSEHNAMCPSEHNSQKVSFRTLCPKYASYENGNRKKYSQLVSEFAKSRIYAGKVQKGLARIEIFV